MKWTDPNVKLIAAGSSNFGPGSDWTGWNRTVLEYLKRHADYLSLHRYVGNPQNDYYDFLASALDLDDKIETAEGTIRAALSGEPKTRQIHIAFDEWNVWYRARGAQQRGRRILEERLQPRRRAGCGDVPELVCESCASRQNCEHGAVGQRDCTDFQ